ncbi:ATP-binding protein [Klebsiella pneumoniae]|nr:ATP-binding protein [Klebsiella pneumoniae]
MRDYATVAPQFWLGKTGRELRKKGAEAQVVSFYLMTSPHANMLGLYYLPILYIAHETGLGLEGASKGLKSTIEAGFCSYDEDTEMVWVHEMAAYQAEASLLDDLCRVDLLILDEVGIQRGSSGEKVILNQVIDRRLSSMRPVGILTNLNYESLTDTLGARILDRLQMDGGMWVNFDWDSYRKNVRHLRVVK